MQLFLRVGCNHINFCCFSDYDQLEEGFHCLRLKVAELTRQRDDAELLIPSYKVLFLLLTVAVCFLFVF